MLAISSGIAACEAVAVEALVPTSVGFAKHGMREPRQTTHVKFVRPQPSGRAHGVVVRKFDPRKVGIPIALSLVDTRSKYLSYRVVDNLNAEFPVRVVGPGDNFPKVEEVEGSYRRLCKQKCITSPEGRLRGQLRPGMYLLTSTSAVPSR